MIGSAVGRIDNEMSWQRNLWSIPPYHSSIHSSSTNYYYGPDTHTAIILYIWHYLTLRCPFLTDSNLECTYYDIWHEKWMTLKWYWYSFMIDQFDITWKELNTILVWLVRSRVKCCLGREGEGKDEQHQIMKIDVIGWYCSLSVAVNTQPYEWLVLLVADNTGITNDLYFYYLQDIIGVTETQHSIHPSAVKIQSQTELINCVSSLIQLNLNISLLT